LLILFSLSFFQFFFDERVHNCLIRTWSSLIAGDCDFSLAVRVIRLSRTRNLALADPQSNKAVRAINAVPQN
jgi:hypothetical protein